MHTGKVKVITEDTRNQKGKHELKRKWFAAQGIEVVRSKLEVGDYSLPCDRSKCIDTKKDLMELANNLGTGHKRFSEELKRAERFGIQLIILCEHGDRINRLEDVEKWRNPYSPKKLNAMSGRKMAQIMRTFQKRYGCKFLFCRKEETAEKILQLLEN